MNYGKIIHTVWGCGLDSTGSGRGPVMGSCEHSNEPPVFIKGGEFLKQLSNYKILKELVCWGATPKLSSKFHSSPLPTHPNPTLQWTSHKHKQKQCNLKALRFPGCLLRPVLLRGLMEKFVDSPSYSELDLCGGAVMVSFFKSLPWQVMHFLQHSAHFSKTCCRLLITSKFLALVLPFRGWKSPEITWGEIWTVWQMF
jgi:hypothetical protein